MSVTRELKMILIARSGLMKTSKMMTREMYLTFFMMRKVCKLIFYCDMIANRCIQNPWKNHLSLYPSFFVFSNKSAIQRFRYLRNIMQFFLWRFFLKYHVSLLSLQHLLLQCNLFQR